MNNKLTKFYKNSVNKGFLLSIRSKMLIYFGTTLTVSLILLELLNIYGVPFTAFRGLYSQEQSEVFQTLSLVADLKKERLLRWIKERRDDTKVISNSSIIKTELASLLSVIHENRVNDTPGDELWTKLQKEKSYQALTQHLNLVKTVYGVYDRIQIGDASTGTIIASTHNEDLGMNISPENYFSNVLQQGYQEMMNIDKDLSRGILRLFILHTIDLHDNEDKISAVLIMHINPDDFIKPILHTGTGLGQTGEVLIVNQDVKILTSLKHLLADGTTAVPLVYKIKAKPAVFAARGEEGIIATEDYRGIRVLAAFRHLRITSELGWGLVVKQDEAEVFTPLQEIIYYRVIIGFICTVLMMGLIIIISRNLSGPIRYLNRSIQKVEAGDLNVQVQVKTMDEISTLANAFNTMIHSLKKAQDELVRKEKLATIGRFAGSIAHDIRHPLTTIKNSSYFLNMTVKDADEKTKKHLKIITDEVSFANKIVTNLLDASRIRKPERMKTDLNGFIREYMNEYLLPDGIKVATEFDNRCPEVMADRIQIKQLFDNLVVNAIDAMSGGGTLTIRTRHLSSVSNHPEKEKPVTNDQEQMTKSDFIEISFEDTGSGIKKEDLEKVFEPLFTTKQKGTGLGMSIVKNIVDAHGGNISVESEEGKGSKFRIAFPDVGH